jgi:hypothetical protein
LGEKQGITNTLALPIDKMLYIYLLCPHSECQKNPFQSKQSKHFHQRNQFTQCETSSNKVKFPKVGSKAIVPVAGPTNKKISFQILSNPQEKVVRRFRIHDSTRTKKPRQASAEEE